MNMAKRIYLTVNLAALWIAALLVCDSVGLGKLSPLYGAAVMFALVMSTVTAYELIKRK